MSTGPVHDGPPEGLQPVDMREPLEGESTTTAPRQSPVVPSPEGSSPPANPLLQRYRGHRTRTWTDQDALNLLEHLGNGDSISRAALKSGIPRSEAYYHPQLVEAIGQVYSREGADAYENALQDVVAGTQDPKTTSAIVAGLKLHGRLKDNQGPATVINVQEWRSQHWTQVNGPIPAPAPIAPSALDVQAHAPAHSSPPKKPPG